MQHIILGTAGHIDHGKSSLVKALTGIDPDRLKEEKERGITIDLGFADLVYPENGLTVGIIDVPGHERLIRNMLAGAGGIDMVLLVIAADEGIMPQSREHLAICNLLQIKSGIIAVTKADLVEKEWLVLVQDEIRSFVKESFLEHAPIIPVSARSGENLDLLREEIKKIAVAISAKPHHGLFRLPIDRVFTLKGFGTVITGTAISGTISLEDSLEILPAGISTKVRGLHSHGRSLETAYAGQRVALNLQGVEKEDLQRGDVAVTPSRFSPTKTIDGFLELLSNAPVLKNKSLLHFYSGTAESVARVLLYDRKELSAGESCYCHFRLSRPVIVMSGDRYIIRRFSPLETMGGGEILDPSPVRKRRSDRTDDLSIFHTGNLDKKISRKIKLAGPQGIAIAALEGWINATKNDISAALRNLKMSGEVLQYEEMLIHQQVYGLLLTKIEDLLEMFHKNHPLKSGMSKEEVRNQLNIEVKMFNFVLANSPNIVLEKNLLRMKHFAVSLSSNEESFRERITDLLEKGGFQPPVKDEVLSLLKMGEKQISDILNLLSKDGKIIRVNESIYLSEKSYQKMLSLLHTFFSNKKEITVAEFRDLLHTSRKYALPFLEYLDAKKVTVRTGDVRKLLLKK